MVGVCGGVGWGEEVSEEGVGWGGGGCGRGAVPECGWEGEVDFFEAAVRDVVDGGGDAGGERGDEGGGVAFEVA